MVPIISCLPLQARIFPVVFFQGLLKNMKG
jgi:hypothetical protein